MKRSTALAAVLSGTFAASAAWAENVTIEVGYPYSALFDVTFERIIPLFKEAHPDIDVKFRATYDNYEDGTNTILRESVADKLPDITFQGLNRQAILVEKGIARSLEPFIARTRLRTSCWPTSTPITRTNTPRCARRACCATGSPIRVTTGSRSPRSFTTTSSPS